MMYKIGVEQTVQLAMDSDIRALEVRKNVIELALKHVDDPNQKLAFIQQLIQLSTFTCHHSNQVTSRTRDQLIQFSTFISNHLH